MSTPDNKYLLKTECDFLIDNFIEKVKVEYPKHVIVYCASTEEFIEHATVSNIFNDDNKIIVLKDLDPDSLDPISAIMHSDTSDVWVFVLKQKVPKVKAYTVIKGACKYFAPKELDEAQCAVWVRKWLEDLKLIFSEDIPSYIVSRVGVNISKLHNEIKKVAAYYSDSKDRVLTQIGCNEFFAEDAEAGYFEIVENFFRKRVKEVFEGVDKVDEYSLVKLLYMLIGQTEKIYKVAIYREQKMSPDDISAMLSVPKFIVTTKFFSYLSFYNKTKLMMLLDLFNDLDTQLRLTKLPKKLLFDSYLLKAMKT
jgi:DNA polymerase III delta subunit